MLCQHGDTPSCCLRRHLCPGAIQQRVRLSGSLVHAHAEDFATVSLSGWVWAVVNEWNSGAMRPSTFKTEHQRQRVGEILKGISEPPGVLIGEGCGVQSTPMLLVKEFKSRP